MLYNYDMDFRLFLATPRALTSWHVVISKQQRDQGTRV